MKARAEESHRVLWMLRDLLLAWGARLLPKPRVSLAVSRALNQWEPGTPFFGDPELPLYHNLAE